MITPEELKAVEAECDRQEQEEINKIGLNTAAHFHLLCERLTELEIALRRIVTHLSLLQVTSAKEVAERALDIKETQQRNAQVAAWEQGVKDNPPHRVVDSKAREPILPEDS